MMPIVPPCQGAAREWETVAHLIALQDGHHRVAWLVTYLHYMPLAGIMRFLQEAPERQQGDRISPTAL